MTIPNILSLSNGKHFVIQPRMRPGFTVPEMVAISEHDSYESAEAAVCELQSPEGLIS